MQNLHGTLDLDSVKIYRTLYISNMNRKKALKSPPQLPYHHGDLRKTLIQAGIEILEEQGLTALSLREVARRAGVSHAAPYHHFPDKHALVSAVAGYGFQKLRDAMAAQAGSSSGSLDGLQGYGIAYTRFAKSHPALFRLMYTQESILLPPEEPQPTEGVVDDLTLTGIRQATGCTLQQAKQINLLLWSSVHGLAMLWLDGKLGPSDSDDLERKTLEITDLLGHVLRANFK